jgi:hypothetical protein
MLQRGLAQVIFIGDCPQHPAGVHRSEIPQLNVSDAIADVIVPDFLVAFLRRSAFFLEIRQIDFFDELRERHPRLRREIAGIQLAQELREQRLDQGFARIVFKAPQSISFLLEFDRTIFLPDALAITHVPGIVMNVQMALLVSNRFGHIFLL